MFFAYFLMAFHMLWVQFTLTERQVFTIMKAERKGVSRQKERNEQIMEKSFKTTKVLVSALAAMLVLICTMLLMTDTAAAATKYQLASPFMLSGQYREDFGQDGHERLALAGGYYWNEWGGTPAVSKLYYSKTEDGTGTLIGKTTNTDSLIRNLDGRILTNGSKVYYTLESKEEGTSQEGSKTGIYCGSVSGSKAKLVKTITQHAGNGKIELVNIYGGKLYYRVNYSVYGDYLRRTPLYSLDLKMKKVKKLSGDFDSSCYYNSGGTRYLYGDSFDKDGLRIFDCKKDKFSRTINPARLQGNAIDSGRLYYQVNNSEKDYTKIYSASLSGADRKLVLEGLPFNTWIDVISKDYICYSVNGELEGHVYMTATGEDRKLDGTAYYNFIKDNPHGANIYTGSGKLRG